MATKRDDELPETQPPAEDDSWADPKKGDGAEWKPGSRDA